MRNLTDPLAGQREAINAGRKTRLVWPDKGEGFPIKEGEVFKLRDCSIEITRLHRSRRDGRWFLEAEFTRYSSKGDRVHLLRRGRSGYTARDGEAMRAHDDPDAGTMVRLNEGQEPEPEAVPPDEIGTYTGDQLARARFDREQEEARAAMRDLPIEQRLAALRQLADEKHVDISSEERVIRKRLDAIERKVMAAAA